MIVPNVVLAYLSPETVPPMTSIVAAIVGGSMLLTRRMIHLFVRGFRAVLRRPQRLVGSSKPHTHSPGGVLEQ